MDQKFGRVVAREEGRVHLEANDLAADAELDDTPIVSRLTLNAIESENKQYEMFDVILHENLFVNKLQDLGFCSFMRLQLREEL